MNKDPIIGLTPRKLARILGLTLTSDQEDDPTSADVAELLNKCLHAHLHDEGGKDFAWIDLLGDQWADHDSPDGTALIDLLISPKSSLKTIKAIRKCAKQRAARNAMDPEYSVAITVYFAAIASAILFHGSKITTYSYESLEISFSRLASKTWMPEELGFLLTRARDLCSSRR
jgi:hypothetical protein